MEDPAEQVVREALSIMLEAEEKLSNAHYLAWRGTFCSKREAIGALDNFSDAKTALVELGR